MNDVFLALLGPVLIIVGVVVGGVIDHFRTDCKHEYGDWYSFPSEHSYVQQRQCKKCQFTYTYQERKIGHEQHQHNNVHKG